MIDKILDIVEQISIPGFFVTAEVIRESDSLPQGIERFIQSKHESICNGIQARKFKYQEQGWVLTFTFFPTNRVVDEKYAMKNKVFK